MGIGQVIKGYELQERIGSGGFGAVYRAYQSTVGREVAMKIILPHFANHPDFIRRFETEAQLVARLEHPYIIPLYDYWRELDGAYLVMRWLRGGNLHEALQDGPFALEAAVMLVDQITSALTVAHRNGIVHRDLKPANILLDEDGNAYLADFGIAKDTTNAKGSMTEADAVVGSPDYLAPEQARSEPVTPQTDIYSLGVVLYEVLTGHHPFPSITPIERLYKHLNESLPNIDTLPPEVRDAINAVIQRATAKNPAHRYPDVLAMAAAFREACAISGQQSLLERLTRREQEILQFIIEGRSNKEIAQELFVSVTTVKWHIRQIYAKLGVRSRMQAIVRARELNLLFTGEPQDSEIAIDFSIEPENPYKGLHAFSSADYRDFFGREKLIERLVKRLNENGAGARFLVVVGPSGSGKSSLVKAGLIPAIWRGTVAGSEKWFVVEMLPGARPLDELEIALAKVASQHAGSVHEHLERDEYGLSRIANLILPNDGSDMLLVIDQFEEVFTLVDDEKAREHFLNLLHAAVTAPRSRVRVVITLRADFYDRPLHYPAFGELMRNHMETVLPLSADELERAIARPADGVGVQFEPGLVASIVGEVNYQPGALPLLQYALTELFERREGRQLTREVYQAIGGTVGALAKRADEIYLELDETGREAARQMFLRLVTLGEGTGDTRRRVARSELLAIVPDVDLMDDIIDTYATYRLLSLDNDPATRTPTVEVAHEAILREWERLREWLNESREEIRLQRQLMALTAEWENAKRDASFLLRGSRLEIFEKWVVETQLALTAKERAYVDASLLQREKEQVDEEKRRAKEYVTARRAQTFQRASVVLGIFVVLAITTAILAGIIAASAQSAMIAAASTISPIPATLTSVANNVEIAETHIVALNLVALANEEIQNNDVEAAVLLGIRSLNTAYTPQADALLTGTLDRLYTLHVFRGHTANVIFVAFSPDGGYVLTASADRTAQLWDVETGEVVRTFSGHSDAVMFATFSPDGRYVLTGSNDSTARLWDVETGETMRTFSGHSAAVMVSTFSPDGRFVLTGSLDRTASLWDVETGTTLRTFSGHTGRVNFAAFSPDGRYIVTGSGDGTARLWDVETGETLRIFSGHTGDVLAVAFSPDGRYVLTGGEDSTTRLWDATTGELLRTFGAQTDMVFSVGFSPDGQYIITGSSDSTARLYEAETGELLRTFYGHQDIVSSVAFSPDGRYVLTGSFDDTARLWDAGIGEVARTFRGHTNAINAVAFSPDGRYAVTGSGDSTAQLWDVETGEVVRTFALRRSVVTTVAFSPDGHYIATGSADRMGRLWDVETGEQIRTFSGHSASITSGAFSPDGRYLLTGSADRSARLWDTETGEQLRVFEGHTAGVAAVAFSPDGRYVVTGSGDNTAQLWDTETGEQLRVFEGHTAGVTAIAFSPDGRYLLTGSADRSARLWDVVTGEQVRVFEGHTTGVTAVAFSPDGRYIVTGSSDNTARLWDVVTGEQLRVFEGHTAGVTAVAFSPDGHSFLTGSFDQTARLWDTTYQDLIAYACTRVFRDFTIAERQEWQEFGIDDTPTCPQFGMDISTQPTWTPLPTLALPIPSPTPESTAAP